MAPNVREAMHRVQRGKANAQKGVGTCLLAGLDILAYCAVDPPSRIGDRSGAHSDPFDSESDPFGPDGDGPGHPGIDPVLEAFW